MMDSICCNKVKSIFPVEPSQKYYLILKLKKIRYKKLEFGLIFIIHHFILFTLL
jgi:hypothetical protein